MAEEKAVAQWENPIRVALREGKPVFGITISTPSVEMAAQAADMGFDFLWIEMEHSPITLETVRNMILATRGSRAMPFVRVPVVELWTAKRVMDMGALGVIFPFVSTAESAQTAAQACKYPPAGLRGSGAGLATFRWPAPGGYYDFADQNIVVVTNIEDTTALENIDAIAATPGVDVLFIGTSDLSFSSACAGSRIIRCFWTRYAKWLKRPARRERLWDGRWWMARDTSSSWRKALRSSRHKPKST